MVLGRPLHGYEQQTNTSVVQHTISVCPPCPAVRHGGVREYDTHNLFGTAMAHDHYRAFKAITGKRPFLLTRYDWPVHLNPAGYPVHASTTVDKERTVGAVSHFISVRSCFAQ